jgi:hypothetical protein
MLTDKMATFVTDTANAVSLAARRTDHGCRFVMSKSGATGATLKWMAIARSFEQPLDTMDDASVSTFSRHR